MYLHFATCDRKRAFEFIKKVYPSYKITDTSDCVKDILDLVQEDRIRIQDPLMHGNLIQVIKGNNWENGDNEKALDAYEILKKFIENQDSINKENKL